MPRRKKEAIRLVQLARAAGEVCEPAADFEPASAHGEFVYSAPEIVRVRDRRDRLDLAWEVINHPERFKKMAWICANLSKKPTNL
jgi:hypothetical protein